MSWATKPLGAALTFQRGFDITKAEQQPGPYWVISSSGPSSQHSQHKVEGPGVVIGRKGSLGTVHYSADDFWPHDTTLWVKDFHGNDPRFAYYFLQTMGFERLDVGASNPTLNRNHIHVIPIYWPEDLSEQRRIASILSAYDDLIENNTRRIGILEEMARRIYEEWFVRFRFPGHEGLRMVESKLGLIPEGWAALTVGGVLRSLESGSRPKGGIDPNERGVPSIGAENINGLGRYDYGKEKFVSREFFGRMTRGRVRSGDVLLYKDGAHIGKKSLFRDGFPHEECAVNEHVFILRPDARVAPAYLFFWLDQDEMTQRIRALNANAAQPGINQPGVNGLPLLLPPPHIMSAFATTVEPLLALLFNLAKNNPILCATRDLLLHKLISGELGVSAAAAPEALAA